MPLKCLCSFLCTFCVDKKYQKTRHRVPTEKLRFSKFLYVCDFVDGAMPSLAFYRIFVITPSQTSLRVAIPNIRYIPAGCDTSSSKSHARQTFRRTASGSYLPRKRFSGRYFIKIPIEWMLESLRSLEVILFCLSNRIKINRIQGSYNYSAYTPRGYMQSS